MKHNLKILFNITHNTWQRHLEYRGAAIIWILNGFIIPTLLTVIWLTIRRHQQLPLDSAQIITYYFLSTISVRITQSWTGSRVGYQIKDGQLSRYLIQPLPYWIYQLGLDLGQKVIRLISLIPFVTGFIIIFSEFITIASSPTNWVLSLLSLLLGFIINFMIQNLIGLGALWVEHVYGLSAIYESLEALLGGVTIPFALMPSAIAAVSLVLPFRYIVGFPVELVMGTLPPSGIIQGFAILSVWMVILYTFWHLVFRLGIKNYTAVGI